MKTLALCHRNRRRGYALLYVMVFGSVALLILAGAVKWTATGSRLNARNNEYYEVQFAAEAATEKVLTRLSSDFKGSPVGETTVFNSLGAYRDLYPTTSEDANWAGYYFSDAAGNSNKTWVGRVTNVVFIPLESQYHGLNGYASTYRIIANVRAASTIFTTNLIGAVQQEIQLATIPIFQFALFHSEILDLTGSATLSVRGRVHSNKGLYAGSSASQTFYGDVTTVGVAGKVPYAGYTMSDYTGTLSFNGPNGTDTNVSALTLPIGTNNTALAVHDVINPPTASETTNYPISPQRFFNKAQLVVQVRSTGVVIYAKTPLTAGSNAIPTNGFLGTVLSTNRFFYDQREDKTNRVIDFNYANFTNWARTNSVITSTLGSGVIPSLIYINDERTFAAGQMAAVRLANAAVLATNGLTLATQEPLYVQGHFNAPTSTEQTYSTATNVANTKPASLICDAITILSSAWDDTLATKSAGYGARNGAVNTTINAAILAGEVYGGTNGVNPYSAGMMNLPRLLENWSSDTLTINGSMVCLFNSTNATGWFKMPGTYYNAPTRQFAWNTNFADPAKLPPGTPGIRTLIRSKWILPPPSTTNFAGF